MKEYIKPIQHYVDIYRITSSIQKLSIEYLLTYLSQYGIMVWKIDPNIFIALDFESRHKYLRRVSMVSIPTSEDSLLKSALEIAYGVKLYTEPELRNILRGIIIHREYCHALGFLLPCESEVKVIDKDKGIVGIADLVCGDHVIELKSSTNFKRAHAYQLLIYMDLLHKEYGFLVYKDKVLSFSLSTDSMLLSEAYERLYEIHSKVYGLAKKIQDYKSEVLKTFNMRVDEIIKKLNDLGFTMWHR